MIVLMRHCPFYSALPSLPTLPRPAFLSTGGSGVFWRLGHACATFPAARTITANAAANAIFAGEHAPDRLIRNPGDCARHRMAQHPFVCRVHKTPPRGAVIDANQSPQQKQIYDFHLRNKQPENAATFRKWAIGRENNVALMLSVLGGAGTVTGSKYLLDDGNHRILVDCGLFQGFKALRLKNWAQLPVDPRSLDCVVLTHAHIDHSGYLPRLVKQGFKGPVFASAATIDLCRILLPDAGYLQEKDAEFTNRHGFSKHKPALPLFTQKDALDSLNRLTPIPFEQDRPLPGGATIQLRRSGHILGAASVRVQWAGVTTVFSGDLGRYNDPIMVDPVPFDHTDYLLVESTYGNRRHAKDDPAETLASVIEATVARGGTVVIPAFAVGRAQTLLFHLKNLKAAGRLANIPVFLDSPMAQDAGEIFCRNGENHKLTKAVCRQACAVAHYVQNVEESKALTVNPMPKIIISASGMATGGRVLHHLKRFAPDPRNTILFAGFQAAGTRGSAMVAGAESIKIHGEYVAVRAQISILDMLSAHADADELLRWLLGLKNAPRMTFITHGEPAAADALRHRIEKGLGWPCLVPDHGERVELT
jgi:metallo-beta-lactamase family protein